MTEQIKEKKVKKHIKIKIHSAYGEKLKITLECPEPPVEQSHKDQCDIHKIMAKYDAHGVLTHVNTFEAKYEDVTGYDYQQMLNTIASANTMFENLPSEIRQKFHNSPQELITFMDNENNNEEMYEMGLKKRPQNEPLKTEKTKRSDPIVGDDEQPKMGENAPQETK